MVIGRLTASELTFWQMQLFKEFVKEQLRIRKFVQELQYLICVPVMADFIIFSVLICFLFFALTVGVSFNIYSFIVFKLIFNVAH